MASPDTLSVFDRVASLRVGSGQSSDPPAGSGWSDYCSQVLHLAQLPLPCLRPEGAGFCGAFLASAYWHFRVTAPLVLSLGRGARHGVVSWVPRSLVSLPSLCLSNFYVGFYIMSWALVFFFFLLFERNKEKYTYSIFLEVKALSGFLLFIYLAIPNLSCSMQTLSCGM